MKTTGLCQPANQMEYHGKYTLNNIPDMTADELQSLSTEINNRIMKDFEVGLTTFDIGAMCW